MALIRLADELPKKIAQVDELFYRLVLLAAGGTEVEAVDLGKTAGQLGLHCVNVSLEMSRRMLDFTSRKRALRAAQILRDITAGEDANGYLLENIELLFHPELKQDPLGALQQLSRSKLIVVLWPGKVERKYLVYARPDHPEYRHYPTRELVIINLEELTGN